MPETSCRRSGQSIGERFIELTQKQPDRTWCTYFRGFEDSKTVTYSELGKRSHEFAAAFGNSGTTRKRIAICLYQSLDLHAAFIGAILSGHVPAMMPPFSPKTESKKLQKTVQHFLESMKPDIVIIDDETMQILQAQSVQFNSEVEVIFPVRVLTQSFTLESQRGDSEIAFIQHSSGTTGLQKGVALSHESVLRHHERYSKAIGLQSDRDVIISWLPLYHDMGLIACFMVPLLAGISTIEIPTFLWAGQPHLLFDAITLHKPTLCWLPNFAYTFLAQSLQRNGLLAKWDVSSIRLWTNCSEPVTQKGHQDFLQAFERIGCRPHSLGTSYAMAESVFAVTQSNDSWSVVIEASKEELTRRTISLPKGFEDTRILVSCGWALMGVDIKIIEPGSELPSLFDVGEIAIKSDFLFSEYWNNRAATLDAFTSDGYFRTGDSGFLRDHQIYVTGRLKDIIIIQGKNIHAGDVEVCLSGIEGVIPGRVAALGIMDESMGSERLVILAETNVIDATEKKKIINLIRTQLTSDLNLTASIIRLMPPKWLIKSTSGKMARTENREKFMSLIEVTHV